MAAVPQRTLEWLYRVLTNSQHDPRQSYRDPNRTYSDVAYLLAHYPHFAPRTDVYTYENGASALLLQISGTLPVTFRAATYHFPITVWVPHGYPREPPLVYVTPTQDMLIRPGQHVSGEGRVYHHYLANWAGAYERSTLVDLMSILRDIFAKEPPVISKHARQRPPVQQPVEAPPAVPPLPPELRQQRSPPAPSPAQPQLQQQLDQRPPPLPPKPGERHKVDTVQQPALQSAQDRYQKPPPLPPLPGEYKSPRQSVYQEHQRFLPNQQAPASHQRQFSTELRRVSSPVQPPAPVAGPANGTYARDVRSPVSPMAQPVHPQTAAYKPHVQFHPPYIQPPVGPHAIPPPTQQSQGQQGPPGYRPDAPQQHPAPPIPHQQPPPPKKTETPDLLTSPFELELPEPEPSGPPPPIPPNPEKDALLHSISQELTRTLKSNVDKTNSAIQPLHAQAKALHAAIDTLQSEIASVTDLHSTLQSNISILQQSLQQADAVIADAKARLASDASASTGSSAEPASAASGKPAAGLPPIDDVLVAPTVVGKQLYDLVADQRGIERALYALQAGLVKGRIGIDTWAKHTRSLAREAFLKKALIRKAAEGMGLNTEGVL
ncbi:hypothetical protein VTO42DRAFT_7191 [Malbranchea cinnamomea]